VTSFKTRREKTRNSAATVHTATAHTYTQPTQLAFQEHRLQPTPLLTGQDGPVAHFSMNLREWILT